MNSTVNPETPKYKLIFLGDQGVGKSSILNRFLNDTFTEDYQATIGLDFQSKNVQIENQDIHLLLYDTAGQEKFRSLIPMYTRDSNIILLVYDITNRNSFNNLPDWIKDLTNINFDEVIFAIVANKIDLSAKREVTPEEGAAFAVKNDYIFMETSCLKNENVADAFETLIEITNIESKKNNNNRRKTISLKKNTKKEEKSKCICPFF